MELWVGALVLGFLYAFMTMGVFITFRVYNFPDITVDGSFTSGAAVCAALIVAGAHPLAALLAALAVGALSGALTALIHTRFNINGLLSGILVMTGLYSVNLHIMGRANIPLLQHTTVMTQLEGLNPGLPPAAWTVLALSVVMLGFWLLTAGFFKTDLGLAMRATGDNPNMASANGIDVDGLKVLGLALANGLVGVSGGLVAQYQGFADVTMGVGTIVVGLASVIVGESALRVKSLYGQVLSAIVGSVIFRLVIALALYLGLNPVDLKLLTAGFVLLTLVAAKLGEGHMGRLDLASLFKSRWAFHGLAAAVLVLGLGLFWWASERWGAPAPGPEAAQARPLIGVIQLSDAELLNVTRDSLLAELRKLGYLDGQNCLIRVENAHGDLATVNLILDKFVLDNARLVVTISTGATQAALQKIKDRPLVFATVADPFIIDAGKSDTEHLPNVTGVYGSTPMEKTVAMVRKLFPGPLRLGAAWDPSQANAVFNVGNLKEAVAAYPDLTFVGATVAGSGEVLQAVSYLVGQKVDVLVLPTDNIIYAAFDAVVAAARPSRTPIIISDVERLEDGALAALGYDYTSSGQQAARLVGRILGGENPRDIPFEKYSRLTIGFNQDVARQLGVTIPPDLLAQATPTLPHPHTPPAAHPAPAAAPAPEPKRLAIFHFNDNQAVLDSLHGLQEELAASGALQERRISVVVKSAQGEYAMGQAIAQDLVRQKFDYIVTLSTQALQLAAQFNKTIPHVFGTVTDPYRLGVAQNPRDHQPNLTGVATFQPVEAVIRVARQVFPQARRIGLAWNTAEQSSEACTLLARRVAGQYGFELLEANVTSPTDVQEAVQSLLAKGVDLFLTSGDSTVILAFDTVARLLRPARVPYLTNLSSDVKRGSFLSVGADYYEVGRQTARLALRVMAGEATRDLPIQDYAPEAVYINQALAEEYGVAWPEEILRTAANAERQR